MTTIVKILSVLSRKSLSNGKRHILYKQGEKVL
jgi:hypothetical protein